MRAQEWPVPEDGGHGTSGGTSRRCKDTGPTLMPRAERVGSGEERQSKCACLSGSFCEDPGPVTWEPLQSHEHASQTDPHTPPPRLLVSTGSGLLPKTAFLALPGLCIHTGSVRDPEALRLEQLVGVIVLSGVVGAPPRPRRSQQWLEERHEPGL